MGQLLTDIASAIVLVGLLGLVAFAGIKLWRNRNTYSEPAKQTLASLLELSVGLTFFRAYWLFNLHQYGVSRVTLIIAALLSLHGANRFAYVFLEDKPVGRTTAFLFAAFLGMIIGMGASHL